MGDLGRVGIENDKITAEFPSNPHFDFRVTPESYLQNPGHRWHVVADVATGARTLTFAFDDAADAYRALRQIKPRFPAARVARLTSTGE
jgi:hypothetical protein